MYTADPIDALVEIIPRAAEAPHKIACIGSRSLSRKELGFCESIGQRLVELGFFVGTGNAAGADQAYARGGNALNPSQVVLYLPWDGYESDAIVPGNRIRRPPYDNWMKKAARELHPVWNVLGRGGRALHTRNIAIVDGAHACIAWPSKKTGGGGTGLGMRYAEACDLPLLDLSNRRVRERIAEALNIENHLDQSPQVDLGI